MQTTRRFLVALAVLVFPLVAEAQNSTAYRLGVGGQMACSAAVPTHISTRGTVWCNSSDANKLYYTDPSGTSSAIGSGGGASLGNYVLSGNLLDISVAGTMALATNNTNATSFTLGNPSAMGPILFNGTRFRLQQVAQSGVTAISALSIIGGAHTNMTASAEYLAENHQLNQTYQWATGALATQRHVLYQAPTYGFVGASTIANAATVAISGAPTAGTNATITNPWALWLQSGNLGFGANAAIGQSAQSTTNTTALSISPNVADGPSSVALDINNGTALTTAGWKLIRLRNNGTEFGSVTGSVFAAGGLRFAADGNAFLDMSFNGATNIGYGSNYIGIGSGSVIFNGQGPRSDGATTLGASGSPWPSAFVSRPVVTSQIIAAASSITVNPASGDYVRINLSATAITSLTISAGQNGEELVVEVVEDATGTRTIPSTWTNVAFAGASYTRSTAANARDVITFIYNSTLAKWVEMGRALNAS